MTLVLLASLVQSIPVAMWAFWRTILCIERMWTCSGFIILVCLATGTEMDGLRAFINHTGWLYMSQLPPRAVLLARSKRRVVLLFLILCSRLVLSQHKPMPEFNTTRLWSSRLIYNTQIDDMLRRFTKSLQLSVSRLFSCFSNNLKN